VKTLGALNNIFSNNAGRQRTKIILYVSPFLALLLPPLQELLEALDADVSFPPYPQKAAISMECDAFVTQPILSIT